MKKRRSKKHRDADTGTGEGALMEEERIEEADAGETQSKEPAEQGKEPGPKELGGSEIEIEFDKKEPSAAAPAKTKEQEYYDQLIRLAADFDNYKKRVAKEKLEFTKYSNERLIKEYIPIVDNLERAMESSKGRSDSKSIVQGVELILNQMRSMLKKEGVEAVESKGKDFDPLIHEAICQPPSKEHPPNTVIEEHQKAYFLNNKLIRPARVVVSADESAKEPASKEAVGTGVTPPSEEPSEGDENKDDNSGSESID